MARNYIEGINSKKNLFYKDSLSALYDITKYSSLTIYRKKEEILIYALKKIIKLMKAKAGNIRLYDKKTKKLILAASYGTSKKYREEKRAIKVGESISGVAFKKRSLYTLKNIKGSRVYKKPELAIEKKMISLISAPLIVSNRKIGVWSLYFPFQKEFMKEEKEIFLILSNFIALLISSQNLYYQLQESYFGVMQLFVKELEAKDPYLKGHSMRVREYALEIGKALKLKKDELKILSDVTLVHDIGKLFIDYRILNKPSGLNEKEWLIIKNHPVVGATIIYPLRGLRNGIEIIKYHHERINGKGYPDGLAGDDIPYLAKIISVADAFDAMTSERPFRERPLTLEEAREELLKNSGTQFDSEIVKVFLQLIDKGKIKIKK